MGTVVFILGRSGTGKSYSMHDFEPSELAVINIQGKIFPFRDAAAGEIINTDDANKVIKALKELAASYKSIVIDDFQYLMANEFMRRSNERCYDKFTEIARHAWDIVDAVRLLPNDVIVYILCHTDTDNEGVERLKTIGRMLDDKIVLEGMSTIVLKTNVSDGTYTFLTQNNGKDTVKSPAGMFDSYAIDNNLKYVDDKIRNYYGIGKFKSDAEIAAADSIAAVEISKLGTRRRSRTAETPENAPVSVPNNLNDTDVSETPEAPKRRRRGVESTAIETAETATTTPAPTAAPEPVKSEGPRRRRRTVNKDAADASAVFGNDDNDDLPFEV